MKRVLLVVAVLAAAVALVALWAGRGYRAPRTPFGDPDLQGIWTNTSLTKLERRSEVDADILTPAQAEEIKKKYLNEMEMKDFIKLGNQWLLKKHPDASRPKTEKGRGHLMLGYNTFWWDSSVGVAEIDGDLRAAWIVDPPSGRVPYSEEAKKMMSQKFRHKGSADHPEHRHVSERCLLGFGSVSGPPMLNVEYNSNYQIFQAPGHVVILSEMNHDARIIRLGGERLPESMRPWMGDSIGQWDGDTLVVETRHRHPEQDFVFENNNLLFTTAKTKITERFRRISDQEIRYEFELEDPVAYTRAWRAEMPLRKIPGPIYEFACHEGNRSMVNILEGGRETDRRNKKGAK